MLTNGCPCVEGGLKCGGALLRAAPCRRGGGGCASWPLQRGSGPCGFAQVLNDRSLDHFSANPRWTWISDGIPQNDRRMGIPDRREHPLTNGSCPERGPFYQLSRSVIGRYPGPSDPARHTTFGTRVPAQVNEAQMMQGGAVHPASPPRRRPQCRAAPLRSGLSPAQSAAGDAQRGVRKGVMPRRIRLPGRRRSATACRTMQRGSHTSATERRAGARVGTPAKAGCTPPSIGPPRSGTGAQATGDRSQAHNSGRWSPEPGRGAWERRWMVVGWRWSVVRCRWSVVGWRWSVGGGPLSVVRCRLSVVGCHSSAWN